LFYPFVFFFISFSFFTTKGCATISRSPFLF